MHVSSITLYIRSRPHALLYPCRGIYKANTATGNFYNKSNCSFNPSNQQLQTTAYFRQALRAQMDFHNEYGNARVPRALFYSCRSKYVLVI